MVDQPADNQNRFDPDRSTNGRSFSKNEQKRFGNCALVICIFVAFTVFTIFSPLSVSVKMEVSGTSIVNISSTKANSSMLVTDPSYVTNETIKRRDDCPEQAGNSVDCSVSEGLSDYCKINGVIRIHGSSSTIFTSNSAAGNKTWTIKPYPRKGSDAMKSVRDWTIKAVPSKDTSCNCINIHSDPAILFSSGGFSGNHFHDFSDIIIPLFSTARAFNGKVHLLVTNYKGWWVSKFQTLLKKLSHHPVVDIDSKIELHCYQNAIIGLRSSSHKELAIDSSNCSLCMADFRNFLRSTYSLERREVIEPDARNGRRPRLMIISRRSSRRLTNEVRIVKMARKIGYEVIVANVSVTNTNLSSFAQVVNSCDVLMGVHGAGLTNMVFLPDNAVVVQVVPLGRIQGIARADFGEPSEKMKLKYLEYNIRVKESSLSTQYSADDVVLRDPMVIHRRGWDALKATYLVQQNIKLDVRRFRSILLKALQLLPR